jgi:hypothetical protein
MLKVKDVAHHRNGVGGNPFYVIRFTDKRQEMVGILFEEPRSVAVFDSRLLAEGIIAFGDNSWRGDEYEPFLRRCAAAFDEKLCAAPDGQAIHRVMMGGPPIWKGVTA